MPLHVALLRGINVGGQNLVAMADLRQMLVELGFADAKTLLQSGNVVIRGGRLSGERLEKLLETETARRLNVSADYLVRSAAEWQAIIAHNPFPEAAEHDPSHLVVMCLKTAPAKKQIDALAAAIRGRETVRAAGRQLYIIYPDGIGRSKLTGSLIERQLTTRGTGRNWNTVLKLAKLLDQADD